MFVCCRPFLLTLLLMICVGFWLCIGIGGSSQSVAVKALELADLGSQSVVVLGTRNTNFNSFINTVRLDCFGVAVMTECDKDWVI